MPTPPLLRRHLLPVLAATAVATTGFTACRPHAQFGMRPDASVGGPDALVATQYYLSLGNSLATSNQRKPGGGSGDAEGYTDQLYQIARSRSPRLEHVPLACPGETAHGMINGGSCDPRVYAFPNGTQLAQAAQFLETHRGNVAFVTIDVGGNDLRACLTWKPGVHQELHPDVRSCFGPILQDLRRIVTELRAAAGPDTRIIGMNYYSAMLASWLSGHDGQVLATQQTDSVLVPFNAALKAVFAAAGIPTVDVATAFSTTDYTLVADPQLGQVPLNVLRICQWTRMCDAHDVHPNTEGYRVITRAFAAILGL
jgi:lysophospholipase L1-like esterase